MSMRTGVIGIGLCATAVAGTWLVVQPSSARAQAVQGPPPGRYALTVMAQPSGQPRWVIMDTQTGTMELWQRDGGAFQVMRYEFGGTTGAVRRVADPPAAR